MPAASAADVAVHVAVDRVLTHLLQANLAVDAMTRDMSRDNATNDELMQWMEAKVAEAEAAAAAYAQAERQAIAAAAAAAAAPRTRPAASSASAMPRSRPSESTNSIPPAAVSSSSAAVATAAPAALMRRSPSPASSSARRPPRPSAALDSLPTTVAAAPAPSSGLASAAVAGSPPSGLTWTPTPVAGFVPQTTAPRASGRRQYAEQAARPTLLSDADKAVAARRMSANGKDAQFAAAAAGTEDTSTSYWSGPLPSSSVASTTASSLPSADAPSGLFGAAPRVDKSARLSPYLAGTASSASKTKLKPKAALKSTNKPTQSPAARHTNSRMDIGAAAASSLAVSATASGPVAVSSTRSSSSSSSLLDLESILRLAGRAHAIDDGESDAAAAAGPRSRLPPPPPPAPPAIPSPAASSALMAATAAAAAASAAAAVPPSSRSLLAMSADLHRELVDARRRYAALAALSSTMTSDETTTTDAADPAAVALPCYPVTEADRAAIKAQRKKKSSASVPSDREVDSAVLRRLCAFECRKVALLSARLLSSLERASTRLLQPVLAPSFLSSLSTPTQMALLKLSYAMLGCGGAASSSSSSAAPPRDRFGRPRRALPSFLHARAEEMPSCMREHHLWSAEEEAQEAAEAEAAEEEEEEEQGQDV